MSAPGKPSVSGIVLAAGVSTRMGGAVPKQLLELEGEPLVRRVAKAALASRLAEVVVVLGHRAPSVADALAGLEVRTVVNPDFRQGQSTSVRAGLAAISSDARAVVVMPADQPLLSPALIDRLLDAFAASAGRIVLPVCRGRRGAPVLFDRSLFFELEKLEGDTGGRAVLPRYRQEVHELRVEDPLELADVDTEEDLRRLEARSQPRASGELSS